MITGLQGLDADVVLTDMCPMPELISRCMCLNAGGRLIIMHFEDALQPNHASRGYGLTNLYPNLVTVALTLQVLSRHRLITLPDDIPKLSRRQ